MKQKLLIWAFVVVLLTVVILQTGRYNLDQSYSTSSYSNTGTSAFIELLKASGYKVKLIPETDSSLGGAMAGIVLLPEYQEDEIEPFVSDLEEGKKLGIFKLKQVSEKPKTATVSNDFETDKTVGEVVPFNHDPYLWDSSNSKGNAVVSSTLSTDSASYAEAYTDKNRFFHTINDATGITNEFIDQRQNASIVLSVVGTLAKPGETIAIVTAFTDGDGAITLIEKMGPIVHGIWTQFLVMTIVMFFGFSVRFGLAPEMRARQRNSLELVDGMATLMRRKLNPAWALRAVYERFLMMSERRFRVSRDQIARSPSKYFGSDAEPIIEAQTLLDSEMSTKEAMQATEALRRLV